MHMHLTRLKAMERAKGDGKYMKMVEKRWLVGCSRMECLEQVMAPSTGCSTTMRQLGGLAS